MASTIHSVSIDPEAERIWQKLFGPGTPGFQKFSDWVCYKLKQEEGSIGDKEFLQKKKLELQSHIQQFQSNLSIVDSRLMSIEEEEKNKIAQLEESKRRAKAEQEKAEQERQRELQKEKDKLLKQKEEEERIQNEITKVIRIIKACTNFSSRFTITVAERFVTKHATQGGDLKSYLRNTAEVNQYSFDETKFDEVNQ